MSIWPFHTMLEYSQITPEIFIGTNSCCQGHFEELLLSKGVRADISVESENLDMPFGVDSFLWLPTKDREAISPEKLELGVNTLKFFVEKKMKVYVHCKNGHGRAPMLVAAYMMSTGMSVDEAIAAITAKRPSIHLEPVQIEALKKLS